MVGGKFRCPDFGVDFARIVLSIPQELSDSIYVALSEDIITVGSFVALKFAREIL
jgi:hypothetical protein